MLSWPRKQWVSGKKKHMHFMKRGIAMYADVITKSWQDLIMSNQSKMCEYCFNNPAPQSTKSRYIYIYIYVCGGKE